MATYTGTPLPHGIVQHNLDTMDLITVTLWHNNEDGSRTLVPAAVDVISTQLIRVRGFKESGCHGPLYKPENYLVVITA